MKRLSLCAMAVSTLFMACNTKQNAPVSEKKLFMDVHNLAPGKVTVADVAEAHKKDIAVQGKYDVNFIKYWVDEQGGKVYCLAEATDGYLVHKIHKEAHGLLPDDLMQVSDGPEVSLTGKQLYLDIHKLGEGNVTAEAVAEAHEKDLAVQAKHNVSFINYWVDEKALLGG
jgi:hypothetical protein